MDKAEPFDGLIDALDEIIANHNERSPKVWDAINAAREMVRFQRPLTEEDRLQIFQSIQTALYAHSGSPVSMELEQVAKLLRSAYTEHVACATPEPVAPPSPDIAGLVDRANEEAAYIDSARGYTGPLSTPTTLRDLATALQRVAQERDAAEHKLKALTDTSLGVVARAVAAEARIATARDEGLEIAAKVADGFFEGPGVAAAIRTRLAVKETSCMDALHKLETAEARIATARDEGIEAVSRRQVIFFVGGFALSSLLVPALRMIGAMTGWFS